MYGVCVNENSVPVFNERLFWTVSSLFYERTVGRLSHGPLLLY